jgi:hypothetical protein
MSTFTFHDCIELTQEQKQRVALLDQNIAQAYKEKTEYLKHLALYQNPDIGTPMYDSRTHKCVGVLSDIEIRNVTHDAYTVSFRTEVSGELCDVRDPLTKEDVLKYIQTQREMLDREEVFLSEVQKLHA